MVPGRAGRSRARRVKHASRHRARAWVLAALATGAAAAEPPRDEDVTRLDLVRVVGATPLAGDDVDAALLPYAVESADDDALERLQATDLTDFLARRVAGVSINAAQGNPLQPDVQFRGFTATPLLGGAQGLAVYLDGVRVNEVFGDTVNWDLVPTAAIERMTLAAGTNPVFGLNALGGALVLRTRTGFSDPGTRLDVSDGAFGRSEATVESADHAGDWGWYLMGHDFEEDGWRDQSPSRAHNLYGTLSWRGSAPFDLHVAHAQTDLTGNGPAPLPLIAERRSAIFTAPDETANRFDLVSGEGHVDLAGATRASWTLFHRRVDTHSYNGDASDYAACADAPAVLCDDAGDRVLDQHGDPLAASLDAIANTGLRRQTSDGATLQIAFAQTVAGMPNRLAAGVDVSDGRLHYTSAVEAARLRGDRRVAGSGLFVPSAALAVDSRTRDAGAYATDTLSPTGRLALTFSARFNRTRTAIDDPTGRTPALDGRHAFSRLNPSAGLSYRWNAAIGAYAGYGESTRAPTPAELTCADPDAPCRLPNQFLSDPPLEQVVASNIEGGLRGSFGSPGEGDHLVWRAGLFRTVNHDDILFQSTGGAQSNEGFFANVGATRRQGLEASLAGVAFGTRLDWYANASWLDATYRVAFTETSAHHPDADADGRIDVRVGDRIPGLPQRSLKLGGDFALTGTLGIGADLVAFSGQYLRGDEANRLAPIGGYAVLDLRATRTLGAHATVYARIDNVFDRRYASFGTLGDARDVLPGITDPRFATQGAPRAAWVGVRVAL
jgi:iron complex outermembrane recepter protein